MRISFTILLSLVRSLSTVVFASILNCEICSCSSLIRSFCKLIQVFALRLVFGPACPSAFEPIVSCACLICSLSPLAICPSTFAIVFLIVAICACIGSIALVSTSSPLIVASYSLALLSSLTSSSVILVSWSSYGLVLSASLSLASAIIFCCSSIAGLIRSYALSIRCCSFSICALISSLRLPVLFSASFIFTSARSIIACCLASSVSIRATCSTLSILAEVCSMCAFDKKPNMPMLVINIST